LHKKKGEREKCLTVFIIFIIPFLTWKNATNSKRSSSERKGSKRRRRRKRRRKRS
jgi:hypothetical protein